MLHVYVNHPDYMDSLVAIVPLAKTLAWTVAVLETSRKAIMNDPAWKDGNYDGFACTRNEMNKHGARGFVDFSPCKILIPRGEISSALKA